MNVSLLTVQIATWPQKYQSTTGIEFIKLYLRIPNPKKGKSFYYIASYAKARSKKQFFNWYQKGDYLILQGSLKFKKLNFLNLQEKYLEISIIKDFPMSLEI
uniref:Putative single-stranded DNA binding protein Ycf41 n=1 Tax=Batrachospermum sp. TaxID=31373 RepID=A0A8K1YUS1_9FLOR|nr:putative single-stranded DNA binding protein Ycf41 [Batrachospermum sp.]